MKFKLGDVVEHQGVNELNPHRKLIYIRETSRFHEVITYEAKLEKFFKDVNFKKVGECESIKLIAEEMKKNEKEYINFLKQKGVEE